MDEVTARFANTKDLLFQDLQPVQKQEGFPPSPKMAKHRGLVTWDVFILGPLDNSVTDGICLHPKNPKNWVDPGVC